MPLNSTHTDAQLLELLKAGDEAAFSALYNRYRQDVYRYGVTLVKIPDIAEDLVHDVFVKIWDKRQELAIKQNFRSYLFRVCHNRAIDINKEIASNRELLKQLVYHYQAPEPEALYTQEELQRYDELVEEALNTLTPQRRKVYDLCKKEKKSYEEVARELNISPHTVKVHITQTLALLRSYIQQHATFTIAVFLIEKFF